MRIALISERVGASLGGAEKYAALLVPQFLAAGHTVDVLARAIAAADLPADAQLRLIKPGLTGGLQSLQDLAFHRECRRQRERSHYDVACGIGGPWPCDVLLMVQGTWRGKLAQRQSPAAGPFSQALRRLSRLFRVRQQAREWLFRGQLRSGTHLVAPSRLVADELTGLYGVPAEQVTVVYNGIESPRAAARTADVRREFRRRHNLADSDVALLFVARQYRHKGLWPLLTAFSELRQSAPRAQLVVCGSRRDDVYRRHANGLGIARHVRFLGAVADVHECYAGSDVFVLPTSYDTCSLVVLEAMAAGLPAITTRQNGAAELITDGRDGFTLDSPRQLDRLVELLRRLVDDADLRQRMGQHARQRGPSFGLERQVAPLLTVCQRVVDRQRGRQPRRDAA